MEAELVGFKSDFEKLVRQRTEEIEKINKQLYKEIAGHHKAIESLQESELRYRTAIDFTYDWEYWTDPEGKFIYISHS
jgi:PAS domain-containing protein